VTTDQRGVNVFLGNPDGTFRLASSPRTGFNYASSVAIADFDGDGIPDLAVGHGDIIDGYGIRRVVIMKGNGDGTFQAPVEYQIGSGGETPTDVAAIDLHGNGVMDLAVLDAWGGKVVLMLNQGDGMFTIGPSLRITGGLQSTALVVGDFNNDGIPDLAAVGDDGVGILMGHGDGTFDPPLNYGATGLPLAVAAGDFNGDGTTDLAVAGSYGGIAVLLNAAFPAPRPASGIGAGPGPLDRGDGFAAAPSLAPAAAGNSTEGSRPLIEQASRSVVAAPGWSTERSHPREHEPTELFLDSPAPRPGVDSSRPDGRENEIAAVIAETFLE